MTHVRIEVDHTANAAYMLLDGTKTVSRTVEMLDWICVDLDEYDVVVGIEFLTLNIPPLPLSELKDGYHIPSDALDIIQRNVTSMTAFIANASAMTSSVGSTVKAESGLQYS